MSVLEVGMVPRGRRGVKGIADVMTIIESLAMDIMPFDAALAAGALAAFDIYGKAIHPRARLNTGDCAAYALAKGLGVPLLFKGGDFAATDITTAVP